MLNDIYERVYSSKRQKSKIKSLIIQWLWWYRSSYVSKFFSRLMPLKTNVICHGYHERIIVILESCLPQEQCTYERLTSINSKFNIGWRETQVHQVTKCTKVIWTVAVVKTVRISLRQTDKNVLTTKLDLVTKVNPYYFSVSNFVIIYTGRSPSNWHVTRTVIAYEGRLYTLIKG